MSGSPRPALVIGAGVQGLTTGVLLAEAGRPVHVRSTDHPEDTTSGAGGSMWGVTFMRPAHRSPVWVARSLEAFRALAGDRSSGVRLLPGTIAARHQLGAEAPRDLRMMPDLRRCEPDELPEGFRSGYRATLPVVDMPHYLQHLAERLRTAGGELSVEPVPSLEEATRQAPVVVNCAGIGARELAGDPDVYPLRGQTVLVRNPGVDEYFAELTSEPEYATFLPLGPRLVLGGVAISHDWHRTVNTGTTEAILNRCAEIDPKLSDAEVLDERVGLRPARTLVRLESEPHREAQLVHNYGHARSGVALSWGCAAEVERLIALAD